MMGDYISGFVSFLWDSIVQIADIQGVILLLAAVAVFFAPSLISLKERWRKKMEGSTIQRYWHKARWYFLISVLFILASNGQFQLYQEQVNANADLHTKINTINDELANIKEDYRPITIIQAHLIEGTILADKDNKRLQFSVEYRFDNQGNRPSYQTHIAGFASPLDTNTVIYFSGVGTSNPIGAGTVSATRADIDGYYSEQGNRGLVLLYLQSSYQSQYGERYGDPYWYLFSIDLTEGKATLEFVSTSLENRYEPFTEKVSQLLAEGY